MIRRHKKGQLGSNSTIHRLGRRTRGEW